MAQSHWLNKGIMKHQEQCKRNSVRAMNTLPVIQCIKWPRQTPSLAALGCFFSLCNLSAFKHHSPCQAMWNSQSQSFLLAVKAIIPTVVWYPTARNQKQQALICSLSWWYVPNVQLESWLCRAETLLWQLIQHSTNALAQVTLDQKSYS